jgi:Flp pilus assembly protein TadB
VRPWQQALAVAAALGVFVAVLNALGPPEWLAWTATAGAVIVFWRYFWTVNRTRIRRLRAYRRLRRKQKP